MREQLQNNIKITTGFLKNSVCTIMLLLFVCLQATKGTETTYANFRHYDVKQGLISNRIYSLCTDSLGFIWMSTDFGIDRFDGRNFKHHQKKNYPAMGREDVFFISAVDTKHIAGGGYSGQFIEYDIDSDSLEDKMPIDDGTNGYKSVFNVIQGIKGEKYAVSDGGLFLRDPKGGKYIKKFAASQALSKIYTRSAYIDAIGRYWLGSFEKLVVVDRNGKTIHQHQRQGESIGVIMSILPIGNHKIAVCTFGNEIWIYDTQQKEIDKPKIITLPFKNTSCILKDRNGRIWIGTDGHGLWYTDEMGENGTNFVRVYPRNAKEDDFKKIYALTEDLKGDLWIGTQNSGLWELNKGNKTGLSYSDEFGFPDVVCSSFWETPEHKVLIGTDGSGLYLFDPVSQMAKKYDVKFKNITAVDGNRAIGKAYIATWGDGIYELDTKSNRFQREKIGLTNAVDNFIDIKVMKNGDIWASSAGDGLYIKEGAKWHKVSLKDDKNNMSSKWMNRTKESKDNIKWQLTTNSLWKIDAKDTIGFWSADLCSNNQHLNLNDIVTDQNGNLIMASNGGLFVLSKGAKSLQKIDYVPDCSYSTVTDDEKGQIWAASTNGIISIDLNKKQWHQLPGDYSDVTRFYFYSRGSYRAPNGELYFGTNAGFFQFNPKNLGAELPISELRIDELRIKGNKIKPGNGPLENSASLTTGDIWEFNHDDSEIGIDITYIDNAEWNYAKTKYKLNDDEWTEIGDAKTITLSNLQPGKYTLTVCTYRPFETNSEKYIVQEIRILPPWWQTIWFRLFVIALIGLGIFAYIKYRLKNMEQQREELREKVAERTLALSVALSEKNRLISVIAHDLKNPMFAIESGLASLKETSMNEAEHQQRIDELHQSAQTLQHKLNQLLTWALDIQKNDNCHIANTDMQQTIGNAVEMLRTMCKDKGLKVSVLHNLTHYVTADDRMVEIVIENLIANAIKFSNPGGEITVKTWEENAMAHISIADNGRGMTAEQLAELNTHQLHQSTNGTQDERGTGLGIKLCQDYIDKNKGSLKIESTEGKGSIFTILLPLSEISLGEKVAAKATENQDEEQTKDNPRWNILVADDDNLIRSSIATMLQTIADVKTASNGKEVLDEVMKETPDLILSDVEMPEMDGLQLCEALSKQEQTNHIPILFVSARTSENDRLRGLSSGAIDYICKPFDKEELQMKVGNILKLRQQNQQRLLKSYCQPTNADEKEKSKEIDPYLQKLLTILEENLSNCDLNIDLIASKMASSQSTLNRKIKVLTGKSTIEILTQMRMTKAQALLKQGKENITEIAFATGYTDPSYFSRKYKEYFGYTPSKEK